MSEIADASFDFQNRVEKGRFNIVGMNTHVETDEPELEILRISHEVEGEQKARLAQARAARDAAVAATALDELRRAAASDDNLVPVIMDAVRAECTVGEISGALQDVFGDYSEVPRI
jgi:methylmalonyl-CoA mutase N-terminal domain/subunit